MQNKCSYLNPTDSMSIEACMLCLFNTLSMAAAEACEKGSGIISEAQPEAQGSGG